MKLFKYMHAKYALKVLRERKIKVATVSDANDPNEMIPNVMDDAGNHRMNSDEERRMLRRCYLGKHGFISLSAEWDSNPMWGLYGDKFAGIALAFDVDLSNEPAGIFPVSYSAMRMELTNLELSEMRNPENQANIARRLFAQKDKQWSFENEWRRFVSLRECESKELDNGQLGYFANVDACLTLAGVILGPDCPYGIGSVQSALMGHEKEGFVCTCLGHDVESYAVRMIYREGWHEGRWRPYGLHVM